MKVQWEASLQVWVDVGCVAELEVISFLEVQNVGGYMWRVPQVTFSKRISACHSEPEQQAR